MRLEDSFNITLGEVISTSDPSQNGRIKVYCPTIDPIDYDIESLPWASFASFLGGSVRDITCGPNEAKSNGTTAYGWWGLPKKGSMVLVFSLNGDPNVRYFAFSIFDNQGNRSLPGGRNSDGNKLGPFTDEHKLKPYHDNLKEAGLDSGNMFLTRGGYERQVAQHKTEKDGVDGYSKNPSVKDGSLESQTFSFTTPGGHFLSFQDSPDFCRVRLKTTTGKQILLDDTNERIYISTSKGNSWLEMDDDGRIYIYAAKDLSISTDGNMNLNADKSIYIAAKEHINMNAGMSINVTSIGDFNLIGKSILQSASAEIGLKGTKTILNGATVDIGASGPITVKGSIFNGQGPAAAQPTKPQLAFPPLIIPKKGDWVRPHDNTTRNKYWRP